MMLEPLPIFFRYDIFRAAISASTFFEFLTRALSLLGNSSKLKKENNKDAKCLHDDNHILYMENCIFIYTCKEELFFPAP